MKTEINCPFCHPLERVLLENGHAQALLSDPHKVPGHMLVMPKRHLEKPWELTENELTDIFALIYEIEQKFMGKLGDGFDVRQNYRPYLKQDELKVDHLTFHVIPRSKDDYLYRISEYYEADLFAELDDTERDAVSDMLGDV